MFGLLKKLFGGKTVETPTPYKVEAPAAEPVPVVTAPTVAEQASDAMVASIAPTRKPRAPRKPKAEVVVEPTNEPAAPKRGRKPKAQ